MATLNKHRTEYQKRVNRVLDHIQTHRAEELSLEALAAFSPFHFHRVFKSMTGETLREFIQRTRLETAASHLTLRPRADILQIALENGFNSASAFARAFKERFGMSASTWRTGGAAQVDKARQRIAIRVKSCASRAKRRRARSGKMTPRRALTPINTRRRS